MIGARKIKDGHFIFSVTTDGKEEVVAEIADATYDGATFPAKFLDLITDNTFYFTLMGQSSAKVSVKKGDAFSIKTGCDLAIHATRAKFKSHVMNKIAQVKREIAAIIDGGKTGRRITGKKPVIFASEDDYLILQTEKTGKATGKPRKAVESYLHCEMVAMEEHENRHCQSYL